MKLMKQALRPYQLGGVERALAQPRGSRVLYSAPTGSGKGTLQLALRQALLDRGETVVIVTPSREVVRGYAERLGITVQAAESHGIYTPVRLRNLLRRDRAPLASAVIADEAHHSCKEAAVAAELFEALESATWYGYTATPYRGTRAGTQALRKTWPEHVELLTIDDAVSNGWICAPSWKVVPLVDDDLIAIRSGEFTAAGSDAAAQAAIPLLAQAISDMQEHRRLPTLVALPSVAAAQALGSELGAPVVVGTTPTAEREAIYAQTQAEAGVIVSVAVLGEGVDLPWLRRLVDARPTMSPVAWAQLVGRITRPGGEQPEYVTCCRNLERHGYLWAGHVPPADLAGAQQAFSAPTKRSGWRAWGLECVSSRLKQIPLPLASGATAYGYSLAKTSEGRDLKNEVVIVVHPARAEPVHAQRTIDYRGYRPSYGRWQLQDFSEAHVSGYCTSSDRRTLSSKQEAWYRRDARRVGLDPRADLDRRTFAFFTALIDLGVEL